MGNNFEAKKRKFYMHLKFIGLNIQAFYNNFKNSPTLNEIIKLWEIDSLEYTDLLEQINGYFGFLQNKRNDEDLRECLVIKMNNIFDPLINCIFEKMNDLSLTQIMPLILILISENSDKELTIDTNRYDKINPRFFFIENYTEDPEAIEETIVPIILRFCSIHNELGDEFSLNKDEEEEEEEKFDLIKRAFPFNLNIVCIGRFGQEKSTGINQILQEYKAKESSNNWHSRTKNLVLYQVKNRPIRILDVPEFEDEKTVKDAIEKLKECLEKLNRLKDSIHIILYFLNYREVRDFTNLEYPILEEISKIESAQIIYVITHSESKNPSSKKEIFERINSGIHVLTKEKPLFNKNEMFKAIENNVAFVNFHYDKFIEKEPFGKEELFKKIYDFFVNSKDYKESLKKYSNEQIEKAALKLRIEAERILLPYKIYVVFAGLIPIVDLVIQEYIIKNAPIKIGQIFGIELKYIDKDIEKEKKLLKKKKKEKNKNDINYSTANLNSEAFGLGGKTSYFSFNVPLVELAASKIALDLSLGKFAIYGLMGLGVILRVGSLAYFIHKFCEENLDKFVEYYKKNLNKIKNSYEEIAKYFLNE